MHLYPDWSIKTENTKQNASISNTRLSLLSKVEEIFPGELVFLCACDGHDDLHDYHGPPNECLTSAQCHNRGP